MQKKTKKIIQLLLLALLVGGAVYWARFYPVQVIAYKVTAGPVINEVMGTGTLEAKVQASISPEISGLLVDVNVDQNDRIVKGQLLAKLNDADLRRQVDVARAELLASQATVQRIDSEIASAQASLIKARKNFDRIATLRKSQSVAQNEMERAVEMRDVAEANLQRALASKTEAECVADKAKAALRYNESLLTNTRINAPFDGLVVRRNRNPGDVVIPGGSIMDIISTERIWASVWVDETVLGTLSVGQSAQIVFRSASNVAVDGKVARLGLETDRETREFLVDIDIMKLPEKWAIGQRCEAYIETGRKNNAIFVPQRFIVRRNGKTGVIIDKNGKAKWQPVKTGLRGRNTIEIIDGLTSGEVVITAHLGQEMPRDGRMIRYKQ